MKMEVINDIKMSEKVVIIGLSILSDVNFTSALNESLYSLLDNNKKKCTIIAESDNQLFQYSLITDVARENRISFEELKIRRDFFYNTLQENENRKSNSKYRIASLNIPAFMIQTDNNIWFAPTVDLDIDSYIQITKEHKMFKSLDIYINEFYNEGIGKKYLAKPKEEMLELFDQKHVPRGIFPRNSFYNTDHYQYVIWGFVFNREGKLLIHKRSENAKDNQGMWDKSIGGHIDFTRERSTQDAAVRELIEELYTEEKKQQTGHAFSMLSEDISKMYFLGDWRIEDYGPDYLNHISLLEKDKKRGEENWVSYKIIKTFSHNTPRILPDNKGERWLRVIVDSFIFISNVGMDDNAIKEMKNSEYRLVEPATLKSWMDRGEDDEGKEFKVTPDLKYIMTGELRDIIDKVSLSIKYSDIRK